MSVARKIDLPPFDHLKVDPSTEIVAAILTESDRLEEVTMNNCRFFNDAFVKRVTGFGGFRRLRYLNLIQIHDLSFATIQKKFLEPENGRVELLQFKRCAQLTRREIQSYNDKRNNRRFHVFCSDHNTDHRFCEDEH